MRQSAQAHCCVPCTPCGDDCPDAITTEDGDDLTTEDGACLVPESD